ncbi:lysophospholipid acyltransferase family protein [Nocardia mexicana]|uniref:Lyso-ornithine lipid acyltransferase n=1 Tax=Nocardia mexicana TaxID=279262 RepID=A0A370H136_9NOCA|nr:lysophospholipid acyltransferase family protein [Nocardia mexicana]RDI49233.1 lyso-ornithine lipid acyltransferase [Nocardia mexicana]
MPALVAPGSSALSCPPAAPVHDWMPSSPCGPRCVDVSATAGTVRATARVLGVVALLASFPAVNLATPRGRRTRLHRRYARAALHCCGIRLRIIDEREPARPDTDGADGAPPRAAGEGLLVVAGHVGWTDVLALAAVQPMGFVARGDLIDWPVLGALARLMRVIPIDRERLRQLPEVVATMSARLAAGERVGLFPEGTTWCGRAHGRLRPALFQAAVDTATPVQPIRVRYLDRDGELSTVPGFVGLDTFADSARRVLRSKGVVAEVVLLPIEGPGPDRHDLARRCERAIRGAEVVDIDAHATAVGTGPTRAIVPDAIVEPAVTAS